MNKPDLFDVVELREDLPEFDLKRGAQGTIVECYSDGEYEVEFADEDGQTLALCALPLQKLTALSPSAAHQKKQIMRQLFSVVNELDEERAQKVLSFADTLRERQAA